MADGNDEHIDTPVQTILEQESSIVQQESDIPINEFTMDELDAIANPLTVEEIRQNYKDCMGSICMHGRARRICKECKGSGICIHNRIRIMCKECKGSQICIHNRNKRTCKECKGSGICIHNRVRIACKECKGSQICPHDRQIASCKDCKGINVCPHNRMRNTCKECKGTGICEHDCRRSRCKQCIDARPCKHGIMKSDCDKCKNFVFCLHGRLREICMKCKSARKDPALAGDCIHEDERINCLECNKLVVCKHNVFNIDCVKCQKPARGSQPKGPKRMKITHVDQSTSPPICADQPETIVPESWDINDDFTGIDVSIFLPADVTMGQAIDQRDTSGLPMWDNDLMGRSTFALITDEPDLNHTTDTMVRYDTLETHSKDGRCVEHDKKKTSCAQCKVKYGCPHRHVKFYCRECKQARRTALEIAAISASGGLTPN